MLRVTQLVKKLPAFYVNRRFIAVFTTARQWSVPWARCNQLTLSLWPILILFSHLRLELPVWSLSFRLSDQKVTHLRHACCRPAHLIVLDFVTLTLSGEAYKIMKPHIMQVSPASSHFF